MELGSNVNDNTEQSSTNVYICNTVYTQHSALRIQFLIILLLERQKQNPSNDKTNDANKRVKLRIFEKKKWFECVFLVQKKNNQLKSNILFITKKNTQNNSRNNNNKHNNCQLKIHFLSLKNRRRLYLLVARLNCECCTDCSVDCKVKSTYGGDKTENIHTQTKNVHKSADGGDIEAEYI